MINILENYKEHCKMTDIGMNKTFIGSLSKEITEIRNIIQNGMIHNLVQVHYSVVRDEALSKAELSLRSMEALVKRYPKLGVLKDLSLITSTSRGIFFYSV